MKISLLYFFLMFNFFCCAQDTTNDISILEEKIRLFEKLGDTLRDEYPITLKNLALQYQNQEKYIKAETLFLKVLERNKVNLQKKPLNYAASCINLAVLYQIQKKFTEAEPLYLNALDLIERNTDNNFLNDSNILGNLGVLYQFLHKYKEAEKFHLKSIELKKKYFEIKPLNLAYSLKNLGLLYEEEGKYLAAESYFLESIKIEKKILGDKSIKYGESLKYLAEFYYFNTKYKESETLFLESLSIIQSVSGINDNRCASISNKLATIYEDIGKFNNAESYYLKALDIYKKNFGENNSKYAKNLNDLSLLYLNQGKYSKAEQLILKSLEIIQLISGKKNREYINSLNNLALIYQTQSKYYEAEHIYLNYIENESLNNQNIDYANFLNNLGILYNHQGRYFDSETQLLKALKIRKELLGENNIGYALFLNNLASLYIDEKKYFEAEFNISKSIEIYKNILGGNNSNYGKLLGNLGKLYKIQQKYSEAELLFLNSTNILKDNLGELHPDYISSLLYLSELFRIEGKNPKSSLYFEKFLKLNYNRILEDIYILTEKELVNFQQDKYKILYSPWSFVTDFPYQFSEITINSFDSELLIKELSLHNQVRFQKAIQKSDNPLIKAKFEKFISNKRQLNKLREISIDKRTSDFLMITNETVQLEKELKKESTTFSDFKKSISITFDQIKNKLKNNEVSIDIVSYNYIKTKATDSIVYSAFVVGKDYKFPKFLPLFEEKQLAFLLGRNKTQRDSTRIDKQYLDKAISDLFIKPLEKELKDISNVYLSASGLGHQIDFAALPINDNQTFGSKYKLHILSSPAEIMDYKVSGLDKKTKLELLLYGGIDYDKTNSVGKVGTDITENNEITKELQTRSGISEFGYLVGSKKEVLSIQGKGTQNGFKTTLFDDRDATEESIKQLDGRTTPYVLHLATHGFFFPDPIQETPTDNTLLGGKSKFFKASDDPMMRSGLLFSGANKNWGKSLENQTLEDGILTASEISNLDLSACQLVVLSACETGLGEVKGSEGVFGLQRAFKMAGVKNIIMSLWKVPDVQTAELFDIFYTECFAGKTIHEAFQTAQAKMKVKYSPYYWAGFVLLE